jgi:hypothetical protein
MKTQCFIIFLAATCVALALLFLGRLPSIEPISGGTDVSSLISVSEKTATHPEGSLGKSFLPVPTAEQSDKHLNNDVSDLQNQIITSFKSGRNEDMDFVFTHLLRELVGKNPDSAASLAESMDVGRWRVEMLRRVAQLWADQDPIGARQWAEQLPDSDERNSALTDVCFQIAETDPRSAVQLADQYGISNLNGTMFANLVQRWAEQDFEAALVWAEKRPNGELRNQMLVRAAMVLAEDSPSDAAQMIANELPSGGTQNEAALTVLHQWAKSDLSAASEWAARFPVGPLRDRAMNELRIVDSYRTK